MAEKLTARSSRSRVVDFLKSVALIVNGQGLALSSLGRLVLLTADGRDCVAFSLPAPSFMGVDQRRFTVGKSF